MDHIFHNAQNVLTCPVCSFECNHFRSVQYLFTDDDYVVKKRIAITSTRKVIEGQCNESKHYRGNEVWVYFDGECGHRWVLKFCFHKGNIFILTDQIIEKKKIAPSKQKYLEYLKSDKWKKLASKKRKQADNKCQLCNNGDVTLHVHHRTYENLYKEKMIDLIVLCEVCHKKFHGESL